MTRRRTARAARPRARKLARAVPANATLPGGSPGAATRGLPHAQSKTAEDAEPQALVATWWFDSGEGSEPYSATVRFTGRRVGTRGSPTSKETFLQDETIESIVPDSGPVSITTWVYGLYAGEWDVTAQLTHASTERTGGGKGHTRSVRGRLVQPATWSWRRWAVSTGSASPVKTRWAVLAPLARQPAVLPGIYTALGVISILVAVAIQSAILARGDVSVSRSLLVSGLTIAAGLIGAKAWYAVLHPKESIIRGGWAVDGFLIIFPLVGAVTLLLFELPIGIVLDATAPGVFIAVAIGRIGCFLTGCCAGRCTAHRWGIWSSDRRVGARRIPTQLLESAAGLLLGTLTLLLVLGGVIPVPGAIFLSAFAAYAVIRQVLLRLRVERRKAAGTLPLTGAAAAVVVVAVAVMAALQAA